MTARTQWTIVGAIVAALGLGLWGIVHVYGDEIFPITVGSSAPEFSAKDVHTGKVRTRDDYKGKVVLLNIWATWCGPCRVEMPSIEKLYQAYGPAGLQVVAVSVDEYVGTDSVRAFADNFGLTFDVLHDPQYRIEKAYQTTGYPETFIIGPDGVIRRKVIGAEDWNAGYNRALVAELLGVRSPRPVVADTLQAPGDQPGAVIAPPVLGDSQPGLAPAGARSPGASPES